MRVLVGTSGYQYKAWRGRFYDPQCKEREMLGAYARVLPTVEINNSFYRMPTPDVLARWAEQVPAEFRFAVKAPKRITHVLRLKGANDAVQRLFKHLERLEDKLGCVLFQLPPFLLKDVQLLSDFLKLLPRDSRTSFEFRHDTWFDAEIRDLLRARGVALCMADLLDAGADLQPTADFGYLRLRRELYSDDELSALHERLSEQPWREVYAYFKSEDDAPALANRFSVLAERSRPGLAKTLELLESAKEAS